MGRLSPGPLNSITDVTGVRVGHVTIIAGDGPLVVGRGPVRTGVTAIFPHEDDPGERPVFAGWHVLNGDGEMTGLAWISEAGRLTTPVALTNTHSVGVVRDAVVVHGLARPGAGELGGGWSLPVVGETWDGVLSDINGMHVRAEHAQAALDGAGPGPVAEGCVGAGTGVTAYGFKSGIGTASRSTEGHTVGVLVQANHGRRHQLRIDGVPVGVEISDLEVPEERAASGSGGEGSIVVILATDAPLLPDQCRRLAQRAALGVARGGAISENQSGDFFLAFATGNRIVRRRGGTAPIPVLALPPDAMTPLFEAAVEATEEAVVNALCTATTMTGINGVVAHELPHDRLLDVLSRYGRELSVARRPSR